MSEHGATDGRAVLGADSTQGRARGADPRTLLSEDAAELLASGPAWPARAFLLVASLLVIGAVLWAAFAPIEATVVARGTLARDPLVLEARVSLAEADRLKVGQAAHVFFEGAAAKGALVRVEGPVAGSELAFVAIVSLDDASVEVGGERRKLVPGVGATVEIVTGETTPLAWLSSRVR
jgi:hypothetical protein